MKRHSNDLRVLNSLRGIAVLAILVRHAWGLFGSPSMYLGPLDLSSILNQMSAAVDLFFILSGVVLTISFIRKRESGIVKGFSAKFFSARLLRIGPPYWAALVFVLVFFTPTFIEAQQLFSSIGLHRLFSFATFTQQFDPVSFGSFSVISPFWTLSIEMVFYACVPLFVRCVERLGALKTATIGIAITVLWLLFVAHGSLILTNLSAEYCSAMGTTCEQDFVKFLLSHQFPAYIAHFAIGTALGFLYLKGVSISKVPARAFVLAGTLATISWMFVLGSLSIKNEYWYPLNYIDLKFNSDVVYYFGESSVYAMTLGVTILGLVLSANVKPANVLERALGFYGRIGYSLYLWHMPLLFALIRTELFQVLANGPARIITLPLVTLFIITSLSYVFYKAVEAPMHAKARSYLDRRIH